MKVYIFIAATICFLGCNDEDINSGQNTVHLAGFLSTSDGAGAATYWKDGVNTSLAHDSIYSQVNSLHVDRSSVFIGGWKKFFGSPSQAVVWQDGTETVINGASGGTTLIASRGNKLFGVWFDSSTGWVFSKGGDAQPITDTADYFGPTGLALDGDEMYISGSSLYHDGMSANSPTYHHAQCWRNGQLIFRESEVSNALSIFIHQNDVYMAGHLFTPGQSIGIACYWKNGQRVNLTNGNENSIAKSVFVKDRDVYAAGMIGGLAAYWRNGETIVLTTEGSLSMANSIFVHGTDVHVAGYENGRPAYWKNDVKHDITNQDKFGQVNFVVVGSN